MKNGNTNAISTNSFMRGFKSKLGILLALAALLAVFGIMTSGRFLEFHNVMNLIRAVSLVAPIAFGMTLCLIVGGIDLSVGALGAVASTYCAGLIVDHGVGYAPAMLVGVLMATGMGFLNGFFISRTPIPPFIVTLSTMQIGRGLAYMYSSGQAIRTPTEFGDIGNGYVANVIPNPVVVMIIIMVVLIIIMTKSKFGRNIYAIGGNKEAARYSGINVKGTTLSVYAISGLLAGLYGVMYASRLYSGQPTLGQGAEMDAIASAIVGGTSMAGGVGTVVGTLIGAFIIQTLTSGLNYMNVPFYFTYIVQGVVILFAVLMDVKRKEKQEKSK